MNSTPAVSSSSSQQDRLDAGSLQGSRAYRYSESALGRLDGALVAFFIWFDCAFRNSASGKMLLGAGKRLSVWIPASFCGKAGIWFFELLTVPCGQPVTEGTFLGLVLGLGVILPTPMQMLCFAAYWFILLWRRTVAQPVRTYRTSSSSDGEPAGANRRARARTYRTPSSSVKADGHEHVGSSNAVLSYPPFQLLFPLLILFLFFAGATITSVVPRRSLMNFALWCFNGLVLLLAFDISFRGGGESILWPFLSGVTFSGLTGVYQRLTGWQPPRTWLDSKFGDDIVRVVGTFGNPTFFAEMIGLALPLTLALLVKNRHWRDRLLLLAFAGVQSAALVLTWSRGAWLGFLASCAIMAVLFDKRLLVVGLVVGVVALALAPPVIQERLFSSFTLNDSSNSYRMFIWRGSIALLREYLFRGVGLGAESFVQIYPEHMIVQTPAPHAHSTYLQMLIELGLGGFLALMWFLAACAWYALAAIFAEKGQWFRRWDRIAVISGAVAVIGGHMIHGFVEHTWYDPQITVAFWALVGVAAGIAFGLRSERTGGDVLEAAPPHLTQEHG